MIQKNIKVKNLMILKFLWLQNLAKVFLNTSHLKKVYASLKGSISRVFVKLLQSNFMSMKRLNFGLTVFNKFLHHV